MILKDYLYFGKIKVKDFAPTVPCAKEFLSSYMCGRLRISSRMAKCIENATNHKVLAYQLLEANPPKKTKQAPQSQALEKDSKELPKSAEL